MTGNRSVVAAMVDALNRGDVDDFVSYYADNATVEMKGRGRRMDGADAVRVWIQDAFDSLDGFSNDVVGIYGDGETIALEVIARGTANREFVGRQPGERLDAHEVYVYTLSGGKIHGVRAYY